MRKFSPSFLLLFWATLNLTSLAYGQGEGTVHGSVIARANGSLLSDVELRLEGVNLPEPLQTTTAEDGRFTSSPQGSFRFHAFSRAR
jgi:hypothetical protein